MTKKISDLNSQGRSRGASKTKPQPVIPFRLKGFLFVLGTTITALAPVVVCTIVCIPLLLTARLCHYFLSCKMRRVQAHEKKIDADHSSSAAKSSQVNPATNEPLAASSYLTTRPKSEILLLRIIFYGSIITNRMVDFFLGQWLIMLSAMMTHMMDNSIFAHVVVPDDNKQINDAMASLDSSSGKKGGSSVIDVGRAFEPPPSGKATIYIMNHPTRIDWMMMWSFWATYSIGALYHLKIVLKAELAMLPIFGWSIQFARFLLLTRHWAQDKQRIESAVRYWISTSSKVTPFSPAIEFYNNGLKFQVPAAPAAVKKKPSSLIEKGDRLSTDGFELFCQNFYNRNTSSNSVQEEPDHHQHNNGQGTIILIFPEGTNLSHRTRPKSHEWSETNGLPYFYHVLQPRSTGLQALRGQLLSYGSDRIHEIVDATIAYTPQREGEHMSELHIFNGRFPPGTHVLLRRWRFANPRSASRSNSQKDSNTSEKDSSSAAPLTPAEAFERHGWFPIDTTDEAEEDVLAIHSPIRNQQSRLKGKIGAEVGTGSGEHGSIRTFEGWLQARFADKERLLRAFYSRIHSSYNKNLAKNVASATSYHDLYDNLDDKEFGARTAAICLLPPKPPAAASTDVAANPSIPSKGESQKQRQHVYNTPQEAKKNHMECPWEAPRLRGVSKAPETVGSGGVRIQEAVLSPSCRRYVLIRNLLSAIFVILSATYFMYCLCWLCPSFTFKLMMLIFSFLAIVTYFKGGVDQWLFFPLTDHMC